MTNILTLAGVDLTGMTVYVTIRQGYTLLTKTNDELSIATDAEGSTIAFSLSQEDTLNLSEGAAEIQVKYIDSAGDVQATEIASISVDKALLERVIEYADPA